MVFSGMKCIAQILMSFDWHSDSLNFKRVGTTNTLLQNYEFPISHIWWSYNIYCPYEMVVTVINILPSFFATKIHLGHASNQQHCKQSIFDLQQNKSSSKIIKQAKIAVNPKDKCRWVFE